MHAGSPMLTAAFTMEVKEDIFGYFPLVYCPESKLWVCRTFLLPGMNGTPKPENESKYNALWLKNDDISPKL